MSDTCSRCKRPCVGGRTPLDRIPLGHVRYHGCGLCFSCYKTEKRKANPWPSRSAACAECGRVRTVKPGRKSSTGLCRTCWSSSRREGDLPVLSEAEIALTGGQWVPNGKGVMVWRRREDAA